MSEEGALLKTDELGTNYGDLFNPDEEAVEPKSQESKQASQTTSWFNMIREAVAINQNLLVYKVFLFLLFCRAWQPRTIFITLF